MTSSAFPSSPTLVVDSSAVIAIAFGEAERKYFIDPLCHATHVAMSYVTLFECSIILLRRTESSRAEILNDLLREFSVELVPADDVQTALAINAYRRFGKGRHRAGLNFGDCFSYALAKQLDEPLLCKGEDFVRTDLLIALRHAIPSSRRMKA